MNIKFWLSDSDVVEKGLAQPLLIKSNEQDDGDGNQEYDESEEAPEESRLPVNSIAAAYRLLTPSVKVHLFTLLIITSGIKQLVCPITI